ncbi:MAG TPA: hypothetical protein GYA08_08830 [Chloroflexi bacterium]|nr:hypothetical protein [Chloroflexota bacterium]
MSKQPSAGAAQAHAAQEYRFGFQPDVSGQPHCHAAPSVGSASSRTFPVSHTVTPEAMTYGSHTVTPEAMTYGSGRSVP